MSAFLTYSEIDSGIQSRMSGAVPSQNDRLTAINTALNDIYAKFDIDSSKRDAVAYIVPDGRPTKISGIVSDFKGAADLRYLAEGKHTHEFDYIDEDIFAEHIGDGRLVDEYTTNYRDGEIFIKVNTREGVKSVTAHAMNNLTSNGTWAVDATNSDATNLGTTKVTTLDQSETIEFDADVSQSVNNYALIENSTISQLDLSDYLNLGKWRFWVYLPSITNFTSVELYWGSDSSNYYSQTATTQVDGSALVVGWNLVEVDWNGATENGSPVSTAIDYLAVKMNYAASYTDQVKFRIEKLILYLPIPMKFVYYTYYLSKTNSNTFQEEITTTSNDQLLIPRRYKSLIELQAVRYLIPVAYGDDAQVRAKQVERDYREALVELGADIGNKIKRPAKKVKLRGI